MFPNPIFPIFPQAADLPIIPLYKTKYPASGWKNGGIRKYPRVSENPGTWEARYWYGAIGRGYRIKRLLAPAQWADILPAGGHHDQIKLFYRDFG